MRKPVLLILTNAGILIAIFALLSQTLFVVQRVAQVGKIKGQVEVQRGGSGSFEPLSTGMAVKTGDIIHSDIDSSAEFSWLGGTRFKLFGDGEVAIRRSSLGNQAEVSRLELLRGRLLVRVAKNLPPESRFEVQTPTALATSHGQVFSVSIDEGYTAVDVFTGGVEVSSLPGGSGVIARPGRRVVESEKGWVSLPSNAGNRFAAEPDFTKPQLEASAKLLDNNHVLINGVTESGSQVSIDGQDIKVSAVGLFIRRQKIVPGTKSWKIESTDRYGQHSAITTPLDSCSPPASG